MWMVLALLLATSFAQEDIVEDPKNRGEVPWEKMNTSPNPTPEEDELEEFHGTLEKNGSDEKRKAKEPPETKKKSD